MLALLLIPSVVGAQTTIRADSTVCVAFRIITRPTGQIYTTSVNKVACGGKDTVLVTVTKRDTVTLPGRVDTVTVGTTPAPVPLDPRGYNCWMARDAANPTCIDSTKAAPLSQTLVLRAYGQTFGFQRWMWKGVIYPLDPSLPSSGTVRVDTVRVPGPVVHDTVVRVDTVKVPVVVTPPQTGDVTTIQESPYRIGVFQNGVRIGQIAPNGTQWTAWHKTGATTFCVNDVAYPSQEAALIGVTAPYTGRDLCAPPVNPPELPRATVDTRMPPTPGSTIPVP
jgi:hypothetical protein